jgi:hypothetical protein
MIFLIHLEAISIWQSYYIEGIDVFEQIYPKKKTFIPLECNIAVKVILSTISKVKASNSAIK